MPKVFNLSIISPVKTIYKGKVSSLVVPAALGYLGVWAGHAPLVAGLKSGKIIFKEESGLSRILNSQGAGFMEVLENRVTVLLKQA